MEIGNFIFCFTSIVKALMVITLLWFFVIVLMKVFTLFQSLIKKINYRKKAISYRKKTSLRKFIQTPIKLDSAFISDISNSDIPDITREESSSDVIVTPPGTFRNVKMDTLKTSLTPDDADIIYDQAECERAIRENELSNAVEEAERESNTKLSDDTIFSDSEISYSGSCFDVL